MMLLKTDDHINTRLRPAIRHCYLGSPSGFYTVGAARRNVGPGLSGERPLHPRFACFYFLTVYRLVVFIRCTQLHPIQPSCNKSYLHEAYHIEFFFCRHSCHRGVDSILWSSV